MLRRGIWCQAVLMQTNFGRVAAIVLAGGVLAVSQLPALAAPTATPTVSIAAKSPLPKVTGDVWVAFGVKKFLAATISGTVHNAPGGAVVRLFARQFPFKAAAVRLAGPLALHGATASYTFTVRPTLATQYVAKVFASATATTALASSPATIVYVAAQTTYTGVTNHCGRPVCVQHIVVHTIVPPSTLRTERKKGWLAYFGLKLKRVGEPSPPKTLLRGAGHATFSASRRVSKQEYDVTLTLRFRIGNNGWFFEFLTCQKDSESKDGLNLPGHHGCGQKQLKLPLNYIG